MKTAAIIALLLTSTPGVVAAQDQPAASAAQPAADADITEVVIRGRRIEWSDIVTTVPREKAAGPAMWKLTKDGSSVWVIGILADTPNSLDWDMTRLKAVLRKSSLLIDLGKVTVGDVAEYRWMTLSTGFRLNDMVSKKTYARFRASVALDTRLYPSDYTGHAPVRAGHDFYAATRATEDISTYVARDQISRLATISLIRVSPAYSARSDFLADVWLGLNAKAAEACLVDYLDDVDYARGPMKDEVSAWASGDVDALLKVYRDPPGLICDMASQQWREQYDKVSIGGTVTAIANTLSQPGQSLAVVPFSDLLRRNGVLDRLRAQGVEITSPADER